MTAGWKIGNLKTDPREEIIHRIAEEDTPALELARGVTLGELAERDGDPSVLLLALPLEEGKPFPLEALFCLGRIQRVEGSRCVVYAFREEEPVFWREG